MDTTEKPVGAHVVFHRFLRTSKSGGQAVQAVLLCKRTLDAPIHPGYWALFGGKVEEKDVDSSGAARREIAEELGLDLKEDDLHKLRTVIVSRNGGPAKIDYFRCLLDLDLSKLRLRPQLPCGNVEGEGIGWFSAEEIHHLLIRPEDRIAITDFFADKGA